MSKPKASKRGPTSKPSANKVVLLIKKVFEFSYHLSFPILPALLAVLIQQHIQTVTARHELDERRVQLCETTLSELNNVRIMLCDLEYCRPVELQTKRITTFVPMDFLRSSAQERYRVFENLNLCENLDTLLSELERINRQLGLYQSIYWNPQSRESRVSAQAATAPWKKYSYISLADKSICGNMDSHISTILNGDPPMLKIAWLQILEERDNALVRLSITPDSSTKFPWRDPCSEWEGLGVLKKSGDSASLSNPNSSIH
jgi:hypothetical protein